MSDFTRFMKKNKTARSNAFYAATKSLADENGKPLIWELRPISSKENEELRDECVDSEPAAGKQGQYRPVFRTSKYIAKLICASVVTPDLNNKQLQDSYGVMTPEALLYEMIDEPREYQELAAFVQKFNGFDESVDEKIENAKN